MSPSADWKAELKDLEQAQREIAELFEKMAKLFEKHELPGGPDGPPGGPPAKEKKDAPPDAKEWEGKPDKLKLLER